MRLTLALLLLSAAALPASSAERCEFFDGTGRSITVFIGDAGEFQVTSPDGGVDVCSFDREGTYCDTGIKPPLQMMDDEHFAFDGAEWSLKCYEPA